MFRKFFRCESGATAIEYGLICAMIFLAVVTAIGAFTDSTGVMYDRIGEAVTEVTN
jgi:pilus assembly protein Flp/PilA